MAVTIHDTPQDYTPSDNPVVWTFSSNQTAQDNFVYAVKVFINDVQVATELVFPENGIYGRFDASGYASNNCDIPTIGSSLAADAANYCTVRITVVERYGDPVADGASTAGTNITCWKAKMFDDDWIDFTASAYTYGTPGAWLNNWPQNPTVREEDESIRLLAINDLNNITAFKVELFDVDGNSIVSDTTNLTTSSFRLLIFNVSPSVIIASALSITAADFAQADYYEVSANSGAGFSVQQIDIDREMVYSTYKRLHFLSQWGGIDAYSFGLQTRVAGNIESFGYRKTFGEWSGSSFTWSKDQGRDIDYAKTIARSMVCISDWLSQAFQNWMIYNLYGSPAIYEEDNANSLMIRRRVRNKTIGEKIQENDQIFLEQVEIDLPRHNSMIV